MEAIKVIEKRLASLPAYDFKLIRNDINYFKVIEANLGVQKLDEFMNDDVALKVISLPNAQPMPLIYYDFLRKLIPDSGNKEVFDPFLSFASPLLFQKFKRKFAFVPTEWHTNILQKYFSEANITLEVNDSFDLTVVKEKFDLILTTMLFLESSRSSRENNSNRNGSFNRIIDLFENVSQDGNMILALPNRILFDNRIKSLLNEAGICIKAVFEFPKELFFRMGVYRHLNVVILSRGNQEKAYVASVQQHTLNGVIHNYYNRLDSKLFETGTFVDLFELSDFETWKANLNAIQLGSKIGFEPIELFQVSKIMMFNDLSSTVDADEENSGILLLHKHRSQDVISYKELNDGKLSHFVGLKIDDSKVSPSFLKKYFNTELGQLQLASVRVTSTITPKIDVQKLGALQLYLPSRDVQSDMLELENRMENLNLQLNEMLSNLWRRPKSLKSLEKQFNTLNLPDKLEYWIDSLPFPLSSILWIYHASNDYKERVEHLLNFFEAFAEFLVASLLSILSSDSEFYNAQKGLWLKDMYNGWHKNASFGSWKVLFQNLAKSLRKLENSNDTSESIKVLFNGANDDLLNLFKSTAIGNLLGSAASYRNDWKGHGGITGENELRRRCVVLEELLADVRRETKSSFDSFKIVAPLTSEFINGVYHYDVKLLMGARTPFTEDKIISSCGMEKNHLHIVLGNSVNPIPLLEFITYVESKDAVYFYSKVDSNRIKWVSYHFEADSELYKPEENPLMNKMFELLKLD
jgi:hypothetical protein